MNLASLLFRLQKIDLELDQILIRLNQIEIKLHDETASIQANQNHKICLVEYTNAQRHLRSLEDESQSLRIKLATSESALYGGKIRIPKELQDLQNEISSLKRRLEAKEDLQLSAMIQFEEAEKAKALSDNNLRTVLANFEREKEALKQEQSAQTRRQERLNLERQAATTSLSGDLTGIYEQLRKYKRGIAVSEIIDGCCSVCGAIVRPAELQAAKTSTNLVFCTSCGRIYFAN